jgi:hypothetical protein
VWLLYYRRPFELFEEPMQIDAAFGFALLGAKAHDPERRTHGQQGQRRQSGHCAVDGATTGQGHDQRVTTVASAFTTARFINGESISGNPLGLRIAAGNVPNLVDPALEASGGFASTDRRLDRVTDLRDAIASEKAALKR